jgi:hypothetical protein
MRLHVPAERAHAPRHVVRGEHRAHRLARENAGTVELSFAQHHLRITHEIMGGGEEPGVSRHAAEQMRARIVDVPGDDRAVAVFGGGDARTELRAGEVPGVGHVERPKDVLLGERRDVLAAHAGDEIFQDQKADIGIDEARARRGDERRVGETPQSIGAAMFVIFVDRLRGKTRYVRKQLPHRDQALVAHPEFGQIFEDRIVETDLSAIDQHHDAGGRRDRLGERRQIEHGVGRHRLALRVHHPIAVRLLKQDAIVAADGHDAAGELVVGKRGGDCVVDPFDGTRRRNFDERLDGARRRFEDR